jgi:hypothetical protein
VKEQATQSEKTPEAWADGKARGLRHEDYADYQELRASLQPPQAPKGFLCALCELCNLGDKNFTGASARKWDSRHFAPMKSKDSVQERMFGHN